MLGCALKHSLGFQILRMSWILNICANPANIFTSTNIVNYNLYKPMGILYVPSKSPFPQTNSSHIQTFGAATPQKHKTPLCSHFPNIQIHNLVPRPKLDVGNAHRPLVLLKRRFNKDDIKLAVELLEVIRVQVTLEVHRRSCRCRNELVFKFDEFP